ncbi:type II secretion system minor pseudopilin GspK [Aestuariibacter sp. AA17]|uniref:Type II secretion system protein K n=1 Tax=Fluctibacter corallii TaxID=2984329 RepID=A0ABT3AAU6_9ALTE|nr:type II secretion system minor pseudopilin GspK [Aestuariibacter sp. AA17]MCV2885807.1 type II secretion system minor pseudopilin GspK [Aestuariibacter sp. AA17]
MNPMIQKQKGVALIIVLMVVALVAVLATEMGSRLQLNIKRAANIKDNNQAYWYALGAEQYAKSAITKLMKENNNIIAEGQGWTEPLTYPVEGGVIEVTLSDARACFNMNALRASNPNDAAHLEVKTAFKNLLANRKFEIDNYAQDVVTDSLADWLDEDSNIRNYGAEDSDYESMLPPYLPANNLMMTKSEFRLINGVKPNWAVNVMPFLCVIPNEEKLKININTLSKDDALLLAALTNLSEGDAARIINSRPQDGYDDKGKFLAEQEIQALNLSAAKQDWFDITTDHFILDTKSVYNNATFRMRSLLKLDNNKVKVIRREFGGAY